MPAADTLTIRPLRAEDRAGWEPLWDGYRLFYRSPASEAETSSAFARLVGQEDGLTAFVAERDGRVIGFAHLVVHASTWAPRHVCYLEDLFVDSAARGGGTARALMAAAETHARAAGATQLYWLTEHGNTTARRLYDQIGQVSDFAHYEQPLD